MESNFFLRFKLKSEKEFRLLPIKASSISVLNIKSEIYRSQCYGRGKDFDLVVFDPQTNKDYLDERTLIPAFSSVLIRRVPGWSLKSIVVDRPDQPNDADNKVEEVVTKSGSSNNQSYSEKQYKKLDVHDFGESILDFDDEVHVKPCTQTSTTYDAQESKDEDFDIILNTPATEQTSHIHNVQCHEKQDNFVKKWGSQNFGKVMNAHAPGEFESKIPPQGYICHRCKESGHYIKHCPTNGDPTYDIKRLKTARGIPRSMLLADPDGNYAINSGYAASLKPDEAAFKKEIEGIPSSSSTSNLPSELHCPLCKDIMKDAVMTKCCFSSYCDKCIRDHIITKFLCYCGARNTSADDLIPNLTVRKTINSMLLSRTTSSSSGNSATSSLCFQDLKTQASNINATNSHSPLRPGKRKSDERKATT